MVTSMHQRLNKGLNAHRDRMHMYTYTEGTHNIYTTLKQVVSLKDAVNRCCLTVAGRRYNSDLWVCTCSMQQDRSNVTQV